MRDPMLRNPRLDPEEGERNRQSRQSLNRQRTLTAKTAGDDPWLDLLVIEEIDQSAEIEGVGDFELDAELLAINAREKAARSREADEEIVEIDAGIERVAVAIGEADLTRQPHG